MSEDVYYSVVISGRTLLGFTIEESAKEFAKLFKLTEEKALTYVSSRRTLKKRFKRKTSTQV